MPILPLFNTNNTFQGVKRVVKGGRKEAGRRRKEQKRREKLQGEVKIDEGNEGLSPPFTGKITVKKKPCFLFQIHHNFSLILSSFLNIIKNNNLKN